MQTEKIYQYSPDINADEIEILEQIIPVYNLEVTFIEKVRSAFKINTSDNAFCLKKIGRGYRRACKSYDIAQNLKKRGFNNIADFYPTSTGEIFIRVNKSTYYMTYWINGREANQLSFADTQKSIELLALFHTYAGNLDLDRETKIHRNYDNWIGTYRLYIKDILRIQRNINKQSIREVFDELYLRNVDFHIHEAKLALSIMKSDDYKTLCKASQSHKHICHDSFYYQNIILDDKGKTYVIDLESCKFDLPIYDVGKYIRRMLSKSYYKWDFDICRQLLECYCGIRQLSKEEYHILLAFIIFPYSFWKLGRKKYIKQKKWNESKFIRKINRIIEYKNYKSEFIKLYSTIYLNADYEL